MRIQILALAILLPPQDAVDRNCVERIKQLGSDDIAVRDKAAEALIAIGGRAAPYLLEAANGKDREVAGRARKALDRLIVRRVKTLSTLAAGTADGSSGSTDTEKYFCTDSDEYYSTGAKVRASEVIRIEVHAAFLLDVTEFTSAKKVEITAHWLFFLDSRISCRRLKIEVGPHRIDATTEKFTYADGRHVFEMIRNGAITCTPVAAPEKAIKSASVDEFRRDQPELAGRYLVVSWEGERVVLQKRLVLGFDFGTSPDDLLTNFKRAQQEMEAKPK